jgi:hypothetical protein
MIVKHTCQTGNFSSFHPTVDTHTFLNSSYLYTCVTNENNKKISKREKLSFFSLFDLLFHLWHVHKGEVLIFHLPIFQKINWLFLYPDMLLKVFNFFCSSKQGFHNVISFFSRYCIYRCECVRVYFYLHEG